MQDQHTLPYFSEILLFLALAGILIPLLQRFRINQILGFLAAGALVGPFGLGLWTEQAPWLGYFTFRQIDGIAAIAELGVLFLMFMIGLELSTQRLWALRRWVFAAGTAQVLLSAAIIGGLAYFFGNRLESSLILGLALSLSSTAVVMQLMTEQRLLNSPLGQAGFSILMLQDLAVVPLFILIGVLAQGESGNLVPLVGLTLAKSVAVVVLIYLLGRRVIRPVFRSFARQRQPEVFMALTLLSTLGIAGVTAAAGLSMALGAFLAGMLLAETEFRHEVEITIEPFKGLLMGLFFMSVGMQTDVREILRSPVWVPLSVLGLFVIKAAVLGIVFRAGRFDWGRAIEGGLLLGQGGEFAFIVVGHAMQTKLMDPQAGQFIMLVVASSMFATPMAARAGRLFHHWWERRQPAHAAGLQEAAPEPLESKIIIAGFGRVGQLLARILTEQGSGYIALDDDAGLVARWHAKGVPIYFGNAARIQLLHKIRADGAAAIVLTMDRPVSVLHAVKSIRREYPHIPLFARARDEKHAQALKKAGATVAISETLETGLQLSALALQALGVAEGSAAHVIQIERERRLAALHEDPAA